LHETRTYYKLRLKELIFLKFGCNFDEKLIFVDWRYIMLMEAEDSLFLIVDEQMSLMPKVFETERVVAVTQKLIGIARELSVPILITEHYPEGLMKTIPEVVDCLGPDYKPLTKTSFSCYGDENFRKTLEDSDRKTLVMVGIETHICILQTALQCKEAGYRVFVLSDGVSCRNKFDHVMAMGRITRGGVELVSWEMVAYEWMRRADTPDFKKVLPHIKKGLDLPKPPRRTRGPQS
jgi:nicotinamidase-related amidase